MTQPETADYRTLPPPIAPTTIAWQAWWEDHDTWDGDMLYADLDTAKRHSVHAYVCEEYSWMPGDDPDDEAPETVLTWELKYGRWRLLDGGQDTGVRLGETRTFAAPAGVAPAPDQTALRDRIAEALYERERPPRDPHWPKTFASDRETFEAMADAVLAVLPASVDRADAIREEAAEPAPIDRAALSAKLWEIAEHHIVAEWICCEPLEPRHTLCAKGYAALGMARTLLVDSPEAWNPEAPLLNAVIAELRRVAAETPNTTEPHPPHDSWLVELRMDDGEWHVAFPTHDHDKALDRLARRREENPDREWRLVRETTSYAVEPTAAPSAGGVRQPKEA